MIKFDVVIPTKNRPDDLRNIMCSIDSQSIAPANVIVVDQSDNKQLITCSKKYNIIHIHNPCISGLTEAKNIGVDSSLSDLIFFFDDDIILDANFFEIMINYFRENKHLSGICGRQKNSKSSTLKILFFDLFHIGDFKDIRKKCNSGKVKNDLINTNILPGGITAYRRGIFKDYRFDENLIKYCLGEDMDFSYRASKSYKFAFATKALALHNHSQIGRYDPLLSFTCKVVGYAYFYKKNLKKNLGNKFSYFWVEIGVFFDALQYFFSKGDISSIKGFCKGIKMIARNNFDVPFIRNSHCFK